MALSKFLLPAPFLSRRLLLPAFSSLNRLPAEDMLLNLWNRRPMFGYEKDTPTCRIHQDDKTYSILVDLPGVKANDMKIKLMADNILHLSGGRKFQEDGRIEESKFGYQFSLANKNLDLDNLQANMSDGVLKISAPMLEPVEKVAASRDIFINVIPEKAAIEDPPKNVQDTISSLN